MPLRAWDGDGAGDDDIARARRRREERRAMVAAMVRRHPDVAWDDDALRIAEEYDAEQLAAMDTQERLRRAFCLIWHALVGSK